jgi:hypothetical protein
LGGSRVVQRQRLIPPCLWRGRAALVAVVALIIGRAALRAIPRRSD